ncbi:hypothetical protein M408DRAFT_252450 [Serendipita vermifera MAFF 305830]|uniref:NACHT domain-containing protein n=1 Tax=Serendipita vermifera MAFF 305830 TaxID=933852 RepID=A0A0C3AUF0_SERVB|nr:hypothetical protein M408DRAFT_252450 [Serendipita vermifera MAFF 305830]
MLAESLEKQQQEIEGFIERLHEDRGQLNEQVRSSLKKYIGALDLAHSEAINATSTKSSSGLLKPFRKVHHAHIEAEDILALKAEVELAYQQFSIAVETIIATQVEELRMQMKDLRDDIKSQLETDSSSNSPSDGPDEELASNILYGIGLDLCVEGTRTGILTNIRNWARNDNMKEKIFWLRDIAGTGKTTVAATLAHEWSTQSLLAGRFFFTPNSILGSDISIFCSTVAKDIAKQVVTLKDKITAALNDSRMLEHGFERQFQRLIIEPLRESIPHGPLILVFDALDNCSPDGRTLLLECLLEQLPNLHHVKVLLTSRPSPDIVDILSESHLVRQPDVQLYNNAGEMDHSDVKIYVKRTLPKLTLQEHTLVVDYSRGLFIVAATTCRMLQWKNNAIELLNKLIHAGTNDHLDNLYLEILRQAVALDESYTAHDMMMQVLQIIIAAFEPVSINTIKEFLPKTVEVAEFVHDLGAVMKDGTPDRPIKILHPTFREFLIEADRANGFLLSSLSSHALTAIGCLDTLDRELDTNMLQIDISQRNQDVEQLERKIVDVTNAATRYASSYWAFHVGASLDNNDVWLVLMRFLTTKLLNWVELMSWRESVGACVQSFSELRTKIASRVKIQKNVLAQAEVTMVQDAHQFLLQHQPVLQESALQAYSSALAFTPKYSQLFETYRIKHAVTVPIIVTANPLKWTQHNVMTGHLEHLNQVEFSPDGSRLATTANDFTLKLWDTDSGAIVGYPFKSGENISHMAFSHDSERLIFGTKSSKIYIWNAANGKRIASIVEQDSGEIVQLAFSPTHPVIVSATSQSREYERSAHNVLKLWSSPNGQRLGAPMQLPGGAICFALSPDGLRIACVSKHSYQWKDSIVTLWGLDSYSQLVEYEMPEVYPHHCVSYSPTGNRFVTWNQQGSLYLRDGTTGKQIRCTNEHKSGVHGATFSPDGALMASHGYQEPNIVLCNAISGLFQCNLLGHKKEIRFISFAQDGLRLASISVDQTIRVWDSSTGATMKTIFPGYTGNIYHPTLSRDWTKLVTISVSNQINLYDAATGTMHGDESEGGDMDFAIPTVAFSPDSEVAVCGYSDMDNTSELGLWSLETCEPIGAPMVGHTDGIVSVAFSSDGTMVASISKDQMVRLWDSSTGYPIHEPWTMRQGWRTRFEESQYVTFSPDGKYIAASSKECTEVWNVRPGKSIWRLNRDVDSHIIAFSPETDKLAGQLDKRLCIWDLAGPSKSPIARSTTECRFDLLAFSPTGEVLASFHHRRIQIWKISDTLQVIAEVSVQPRKGFQLGISLDGLFLSYGSSVWDISSLHSPVLFDPHKHEEPLDWAKFSHSLLTFEDAWIHSPLGRLLPIPGHLSTEFWHWNAHKMKMVAWMQNQRTPIVIDCSPLLV